MASNKKITLENLYELIENVSNSMEARISNLERFLPLQDPEEVEDDTPEENWYIYYDKKCKPGTKGLNETFYFQGLFSDGLRWGIYLDGAYLFDNKQIALQIMDLIGQTVPSKLLIKLRNN